MPIFLLIYSDFPKEKSVFINVKCYIIIPIERGNIVSKNTIDTTSLEDVSLNAFAYELLREELLPDLIGNDLDGILYWSGRNLARKYPLETIEEVIQFFEKAGWGTLSIVEHKRREMQFQLKGTLIAERQKQNDILLIN